MAGSSSSATADTADAHVQLYHGSSGDVADTIRRDGLRFVDLGTEALRVAEQFGLETSAVWELADQIGFTAAAHARSTSVSFAGHPINAALYAGVSGGEARREMYQAAWLLLHDNEDATAADQWSFEQTRAERTMVTVRVPLAIAQAAIETDELTDRLGFNRIETENNLRIEQEIPRDWIVSVEPVERVLDYMDVLREYGKRLSVEDLPSDAPYPWEATWWESSVHRWLGSPT